MSEPTNDAFFRHVCTHAGVALIATDAKLRIRFWNQAAGRIFGGSAETMQGELLISVVPADRRALAERLLQRALTRGESSTFEFPYHDPAGNPMFLAVCISPVIDDSGQHVGTSIYIRDVTRRIESVRALAEAAKMSSLGTMAGAIAHHFNNLLGGLVTSADFAQSSDDPNTLRRALKSIVTTLSRASKLTQTLLAFAEGDHSEGDVIEVNTIVRDFLDALEPRLGQCGIRLETQLDPVSHRFPSQRIRNILSCVTANACEAMPDGGTLHIELHESPEAHEIILQVVDTGCGIPESELHRAFEPFYTTKTDDICGTTEHPGLGLAVVHGIVRSLGGMVTLASDSGHGTTCTIHLPIPSN